MKGHKQLTIMIRPLVSRCLVFLLVGVALGCEHRDYSAKCPEGWTSAPKQCQAPLSYRGCVLHDQCLHFCRTRVLYPGRCAAVASIEHYSVVMKQQFAAKCVVDCTSICSSISALSLKDTSLIVLKTLNELLCFLVGARQPACSRPTNGVLNFAAV